MLPPVLTDSGYFLAGLTEGGLLIQPGSIVCQIIFFVRISCAPEPAKKCLTPNACSCYKRPARSLEEKIAFFQSNKERQHNRTKKIEMPSLKRLCKAAGVIVAVLPFVVLGSSSWDNFKIILVICAVVLLIAVVVAIFYVMKQNEEKTIATIPEDFRFIYVNISKIFFVNFIAIDQRNKKMLLDLAGTRKMYDFADIQGCERDTHTIELNHYSYRKSRLGNRVKKRITSKKHTIYDLILHVNDQANPAWQFSSRVKDEMDCAELLISRALDGTLPDTDERRILKLWNTKGFESFLSSGTGAQG